MSTRRDSTLTYGLCRTFVGIGFILCTTWTSVSSAANLVVNGSFETAGYAFGGDGGADLAPPSSAITGWTVITNHVAPLQTGNAYSIVPEDGSISLDLQGYTDGSPFGGVQQVLSTIAGQQYDMSFWIGVQNSVGIGVGPASVTAVAGLASQQFTNTLTGVGNQWQQFHLSFAATGTSTTISLSGASTTGGAYIGLDNVAVNAVPEPATCIFWAIGAIGISILNRRRLSLS
jgi:hypothetical protein